MILKKIWGRLKRLVRVFSSVSALSDALATRSAWLRNIERGLADVRTAHAAQLNDLERWQGATARVVASLTNTPIVPSATLQAAGPDARLTDDRATLARLTQLWAVTRWIATAAATSSTLISVVMPTRNRRAYLERAIASVLKQTHAALELLVVDDGSTDDTPNLLASLKDPRVRPMRAAGVGAAAARNLALGAARGQIVAYLDDDNLMDENWLKALAWAFERWPDTELLYGARIIEDANAAHGVASGAMPSLEWQPFDRGRLEQANYIDMNVMAHRAGLPEAHFDVALPSNIEWDMTLRLTARRAPLELPVIGCYYGSYAPNRIGDTPERLQFNRLVRSRVHTTRAMRVLSHNALFPLVSETYIEEEMLALEAQGASIAFSSFAPSTSPYTVRQPVYSGLDEGIAVHNPDVIMVYWASHAQGELQHLERAGRPFALRVHSFDFDVEQVGRIRDHRLCVGVWAFPHQTAAIAGSHELVPIFMTQAAMPEPAAERRVIASVSAGLPKKNWPLLIEAMDRLSDFERVIVLARSNGYEELPDKVAQMAADRKNPPTVRVNLPRAEVFELLARTSVLLYTVVPDALLGMPMSVIEALCAGACVVTPDRSEMRALCGEGFRTV